MPLATASPTWATIMTAVGAAIGAAVAIAGAVFGARYGRRATVSLHASVLRGSDGYVVVARPMVKAVGVLRIKLQRGDEGGKIIVAEIRGDPRGVAAPIQVGERAGFFSGGLVDGGEEMMTTTLIPVSRPAATALGWAVWLQVVAKNRFLRRDWLRHIPFAVRIARHLPARMQKAIKRLVNGWMWFDQVFVPVSAVEAIGSMPEKEETDGQEERQQDQRCQTPPSVPDPSAAT